jgi:hypothetical protein
MGRKRRIRVAPGGFGKYLHDAMLAQRAGPYAWDIHDLADAAGVSDNAARAWIGGISAPGGYALARLCVAMHLDPKEACARLLEVPDKPAKSAPSPRTATQVGEGHGRSRRRA